MLEVATDSVTVRETLHTHLFRSLCPITGQPDWASVMVQYVGRRIPPAALLRYLVSFRNHAAFHETAVEQIFIDLRARCAPEHLTVYARYLRRGGIDRSFDTAGCVAHTSASPRRPCRYRSAGVRSPVCGNRMQ